MSSASPWRVLRVFLRTGATTYGGMWAATAKLEKDLVETEQWLEKDDLNTSLLLATVIPAPRFMALAGLVGFRVAGWTGSVCAALGLVLPASLLVVSGVLLMRPETLAGPLAPLTRAIGVVIVGILFGNALSQLSGAKRKRSARTRGWVVTVLLFASIIAGAPLIVAAMVGFAVGSVLLRPDASSA